jgi:predicted Fe-Mo cluster-binding NifX family protein
MKVAISTNGKNLESTIDERFGRCRYFLIVETDNMHYDVVENTYADLSTGAGIQAAGFIGSKGVETVITGNCGPKAMQVFAATDIKLILGQRGVIKEVVETFKRGELSPLTREKVSEKAGVPQTAAAPGVGRPGMGESGRGMGGGGGRGMGGGGGRGMGGGGGRGMGRRCQGASAAGSPGFQNTSGSVSKQDQLVQLQQQAAELKRQMETIQTRIKDLT